MVVDGMIEIVTIHIYTNALCHKQPPNENAIPKGDGGPLGEPYGMMRPL